MKLSKEALEAATSTYDIAICYLMPREAMKEAVEAAATVIVAQTLEEAHAIVYSEEQVQWKSDEQGAVCSQVVAQKLKVVGNVIRSRISKLRGSNG